MRQLTNILSFLLLVSPTVASIFLVNINGAKAQTLAQCVKELNDGDLNYVGSDVTVRHTETCYNLLLTRRANLNRQMPPNPRIYPLPYTVSRQTSGNTQLMADCVKKLLYEKKAVCTRDDYCARLRSPEENANNNFGGWEWQSVRTNISESAAAQACRRLPFQRSAERSPYR